MKEIDKETLSLDRDKRPSLYSSLMLRGDNSELCDRRMLHGRGERGEQRSVHGRRHGRDVSPRAVLSLFPSIRKEIAHAGQELAPERLGAACLRRHVLGCRLGVQQPLFL